MADGCLRVVSSNANGSLNGERGSSNVLLAHPRRYGAAADKAPSSSKMNDNDDNTMELCNSPSASARSASRKGQRRVVPVSLSSSLLLPHKKRIKTMMMGCSDDPRAAPPPVFRSDDGVCDADNEADEDDDSIVAPSGLRPTINGDGYDASANLSDNDDEDDSETSMSFGSANDLDDDDDIDIEARGDTEMEGDDEDDADVDDVDVDDDESSFSELSYDGAEFDFGYGRRRQIVAPPAGGQLHSHRKIEVVIEIPLEIRQDMERRAKENEMEEEQRRRSEEGPRIPVELQAIFLRAQRGENVDQPPSSGVAYKVFPSWPNAAMMMQDAKMAPAGSHHGHLSSSAAAKQGEANTHAPTQPRRRGSVSAASTLQDDEDDVEGVEEQAPLVLDRWRPVYRSFFNYGTATPSPPPPSTSPRIPIELQNVFVKAQQGHAVEPPSTKGIAFRVFDHRWGGGGASAAYHHQQQHQHHRTAAAEAETHAAPPVAWTRHE